MSIGDFDVPLGKLKNMSQDHPEYAEVIAAYRQKEKALNDVISSYRQERTVSHVQCSLFTVTSR